MAKTKKTTTKKTKAVKTNTRKITKAEQAEHDRMDKELQEVIEVMKMDYPKCVDYNAMGKTDKDGEDLFELLDAKDKRIAVITGSQVTRYWNIMEGFG